MLRMGRYNGRARQGVFRSLPGQSALLDHPGPFCNTPVPADSTWEVWGKGQLQRTMAPSTLEPSARSLPT